MNTEKFLVTGAFGCIGAWAVKQLVSEGTPVWTYDLPGNPHRLKLIMDDTALAKVNFIAADITDFDAFERALTDNGITHVVHLAALQVPLVKADPLQGAKVNVVGTAVVLEAIKRHKDQVQSLCYASSAAVYGPGSMYPDAPLAHDAKHFPLNLYGVYKHANEDMARIYWQDYGVRSIGLRPYVVYGPGRDQGMTSTPTKAMVAAVVGKPYRITYGGTAVFQYAKDTAAAFIQSARANYSDAITYNLGGSTVDMAAVLAAIEAAAPEVAGSINFDPTPLALAPRIDGAPLENAIGKINWIPLADGVRESVEMFRAAVSAGRINVERAMA